MLKNNIKVPTRMRPEKEMSNGENEDLNCDDDAMNRRKTSCTPKVIEPSPYYILLYLYGMLLARRLNVKT